MPWFWEAGDLWQDQSDWYSLYLMVEGCWQDFEKIEETEAYLERRE
jgi:hypothetical protein